jgi:hypothetical protein
MSNFLDSAHCRIVSLIRLAPAFGGNMKHDIESRGQGPVVEME